MRIQPRSHFRPGSNVQLKAVSGLQRLNRLREFKSPPGHPQVGSVPSDEAAGPPADRRRQRPHRPGPGCFHLQVCRTAAPAQRPCARSERARGASVIG
jgi:hypothetical protein